ncbi:thioesterase II family protein [Kitasatospora sp. NPDC056184]|uniref:thioesterase II family protein n=1 Tax=Kitasatospora sp. NPDC056184 TaxID=3345738 RepID=UPI0035E30F75
MTTNAPTQNRAPDLGAWIRRFQPAEDAAVRLVCLPHAGGAATYYFPVARALAPEIDVLAVQYPGRQDRRSEPVVEDVRALAELITAELRPWCDRPLALFGHSMGALVGYEVARRLQAEGVEPLGLFASGRRAPSTVRDEAVHRRDDQGIISALRELSGTGDEVLDDEDLLGMVLTAVRGDYKAVETYRADTGPVLGCPIQVLTGDSDEMTSPEENLAWERHTTAECRIEEFPGGHFYLSEQAPAVLASVRDRMRAWAAAPQHP